MTTVPVASRAGPESDHAVSNLRQPLNATHSQSAFSTSHATPGPQPLFGPGELSKPSPLFSSSQLPQCFPPPPPPHPPPHNSYPSVPRSAYRPSPQDNREFVYVAERDDWMEPRPHSPPIRPPTPPQVLNMPAVHHRHPYQAYDESDGYQPHSDVRAPLPYSDLGGRGYPTHKPHPPQQHQEGKTPLLPTPEPTIVSADRLFKLPGRNARPHNVSGTS